MWGCTGNSFYCYTFSTFCGFSCYKLLFSDNFFINNSDFLSYSTGSSSLQFIKLIIPHMIRRFLIRFVILYLFLRGFTFLQRRFFEFIFFALLFRNHIFFLNQIIIRFFILKNNSSIYLTIIITS